MIQTIEENREYEFSEKYLKHITDCLLKDDDLETLCFVNVSTDTGIRNNEVTALHWNQLNSLDHCFMDVECLKHTADQPRQTYGIRNISSDTNRRLNDLYIKQGNPDKNSKIFTQNKIQYMLNIRKSSGDSYFNGHELRHIAIVFKLHDLKTQIDHDKEKL